MKLFKVLSVTAICLLTEIVLYSQENKDLCLIRVEQTFHGWVDCKSHTPIWDGTRLTVDGKEINLDAEKSTADTILKAYVKDGRCYLDENCSSLLTLCIALSAGKIEHNHDWKEEGLEVRQGKNTYKHSESERCGGVGRKSEGYDATLTVVVDDPIGVTRLSKSSLTIEDGDKEPLELEVTKFYDNGREISLQYRCENASNSSWMDVCNQPQINPEGKIKLVYEDIVGKYYEGNDRYTKCVGKRIEFRIVKTLIDGKTETYGSTCDAKFFHRGPQFEVASIRRPYCEEHNPLQIRVKFDNDDEFKKMSKLPGYEWIASDGICDFLLNNCEQPDSEGYRIIDGSKKNGNSVATSLSDYLNEPNLSGKWTLKLQFTSDGREECADVVMPVEHEFTIPEVLPQIQVEQDVTPLFTYKGTDYHLFSRKDPYVVLKIVDKDSTEKGRLPYKVYDSEKNLLATITDTIHVDEGKLRSEFETEYPYGGLKTKWANEWYAANKDLAKVVRITGPINGVNSSVVKDRNIFVAKLVPNYPCTYIAIDNNTDCIIVEGHDSQMMTGYNHMYEMSNAGNGSFYLSFDKSGKKYRASNRASYSFVKANNRFLILKSYSDETYYMLDLKNDNYPIALNIPKEIIDNLHKAFLDRNGKIVIVNGNSVSIYLCTKENNKYSYQVLDKKETQFAPMSAQNVEIELGLTGVNSIKYTTKDGGKEHSIIEYSDIVESVFLSFFRAGSAVNLSTNAFDGRYERLWRQYYLQHSGYHIRGIKTNTDTKLLLVDNDDCQYPVDYRVNVLDGPVVYCTEIVKPSIGEKNGSVMLNANAGGGIDYYYEGQLVRQLSVHVSNIGWGDTIFPFTNRTQDTTLYEYTFTLLPEVTFQTTPQTCSAPNGSITPQGSDCKLATQWQHRNAAMPEGEGYWEDGMENLEAGDYFIRGLFGGEWIPFGAVNIERRVFNVEVKSVTDASVIGGKGRVEMNVEHEEGDVLWGDASTGDAEDLGKELPQGTYHWTATHALDGCEVPVNFEVRAPSVRIVKANVVYDADEKTVKVHMNGLSNELIKSYQFTVDGLPFHNDTTLANKASGEKVKIGLQYKTVFDDDTHAVCLGEISLVPYLPKAVVDVAYNNSRCPSALGRVKLKDAAGGELAVDCSRYEIINSEYAEVSAGKHTLYFRKRQTVNIDTVKVDYEAVSKISDIEIVETEEPYVRIGHNDIACKGGDNGQLFIAETKNIHESAQYSLDASIWHSLADTINLSAKTYRIYTRDSKCPLDVDSCNVVIEQPATPLQAEIVKTEKPTCRDNDGKIVLKASGGWDDYLAYTRKLTAEEYENALDTTDTDKKLRIEGLEFGNHTIYVHDGGGCVVAVEADLKQYDSPQIINTTAIPARCYGSADGEIVINAVTVDCSVEDQPLSLLIDSRSDTLSLTNPFQTTIEGLSKGNYNLMLIDVNKCPSELYNVSISQPDPLKVEARLLDEGRILYKGGNEGRMEVKVSGGNAGIDSVFYNNSNVLVSTGVPYIVDGMSAGPISITASDRYNCPCNDTTLTFIEPEEPITIETESQAALCHAMTGSVKVTATGGWGDHRIRLVGNREIRNSGEQSETTFESLYAGDYEIEVEDKYGATATQRVRVDAPEPISHELITTPDNCDGNGSAMIQLGGGTPPYTSLFNLETDTIRGGEIVRGNLVGGREYTLTTWDANRCVSKMTFPMADERLAAEIKHAYSADGVLLTAEVSGGMKPYTYKWRNVSGGADLGTSAQATTTRSGIYRLDVTDASCCSRSTMKTILSAGSLAMKVKSVRRTTCTENNNGSAEVSCHATQPANVRVYHLETDTWTAGVSMPDDTTITLGGLKPGYYCVEGRLEDGNSQMVQFYIAPYEPMEITKVDVRHVSAAGHGDARIIIDFEGGIAPYVLNSATYPTGHIELENLAAGKITISIADSTGNVLANEVEILEPEPLVVTPSKVDSASCYSYSDGSVQLTATGGWSGYQFANGNGDYRNSSYFGELNAGEWIFKVVDKYGVEDSVKVTIGEPDMLRVSVAAIDSVSCKGMDDGAVHFNVTGGTAPYRTTYEKETLDGTDVARLTSGDYIMTFADSHECKSPDTISIYIPEPDLLELANDYVTHTTCEQDNGKIAVVVKGGSLPYKYEWRENGATYSGAKTVNMVRSEAEGLKQNGLYRIDITDIHGCHTQYEKRVERSENPQVLGVATTDVLCFGSSDGIASVDSSQVKFGYPKSDYHLIWPQGQTGVMSVSTLPAGTYAVKITDGNSCSTTTMFTVGTPEPVKNHLTNIRNSLCFGYSDGRIETKTTGGVGDHSYAWNTGETTPFADSLKAGLYTIVVADSHGCMDTATYEVTEPEELKVNLGDDVMICPGNVHVFDGGEYATYSWRKVATGEVIETERYLATGEVGDYAIKVTDAIGCTAGDTVRMSIGENALTANFLMASDAAVGDTVIIVELSNMPVDSVRWEYDTASLNTVGVDDAESYMFNLSAGQTGRYYITMWAYSGGCESFEQKSIDIYEAVEDTCDFKIGYDPLIKQVKVSPNPNDGEFNLIVVLREASQVEVIVHDVDNGRQVERLALEGSDNYNMRLDIKHWGSGIFVLSVVSGEERRAVKVLCVR